MNKPRKWLKKYTKLEYLEGILRKHSLYLGDVDTWPDKNDAFCVNHAYRCGARVVCLTNGDDRFHFWSDYASAHDGVCLWFDSKELLKELRKNSRLDTGWVAYPKRNTETEKLSFQDGQRPKNSAFVKREQYADEREFRIVSPEPNGNDSWIAFPKSSLKKIYLNAWMRECCVSREKDRIRELLDRYGYEQGSVEVLQNRVLDHHNWKLSVENEFPQEP